MKVKTWKSQWAGVGQRWTLLLWAAFWIGSALSVHAGQLLENADFDEGLNYWKIHAEKGISEKSTSDHALRLVFPRSDSAASTQLFQAVPLEAGKSYRLSFEAKREGDDLPISVAYMQSGPPFSGYGLAWTPVSLSKEWSAHELVFTVTPVLADNPGVVRLMFGNQTGPIHFRKFSLTPDGGAPVAKAADGVDSSARTVNVKQLLKNADFDDDLDYWKIHAEKGISEKSISDHALRLVFPRSDSAASAQLFQAVPLEAGKSYCLSFEARREGDDLPISVAYMQSGPPFGSYGLALTPVSLSKEWSAHELVFTVTPMLANNPGMVRLMFGNQTGPIHFRKFSLTPIVDGAGVGASSPKSK